MAFLRQRHPTETMKRYSPKKYRENMEYYVVQFNTEHVGHTIQYFSDGHTNNFGVIERAYYDEGIASVAVLIKHGIFPKKVWLDQIRTCYCYHG